MVKKKILRKNVRYPYEYNRTDKEKKRRHLEITCAIQNALSISKHKCPECFENLVVNMIRLGPGFYECRRCGHTFLSSEEIDTVDF